MMGYDKKKLKFWFAGASTSLMGVLIIRLKVLSSCGINSAFADIIGFILAFLGLFIITFATRKKSAK
jgi:putative flippase GtrA